MTVELLGGSFYSCPDFALMVQMKIGLLNFGPLKMTPYIFRKKIQFDCLNLTTHRRGKNDDVFPNSFDPFTFRLHFAIKNYFWRNLELTYVSLNFPCDQVLLQIRRKFQLQIAKCDPFKYLQKISNTESKLSYTNRSSQICKNNMVCLTRRYRAQE